jgi:cell division protein FtsI/penicillin-binding protein 2
MGNAVFREYVKKFGFGQTTGIELPSEVAGDVSSLDSDEPIYMATASFG